MKKSEIIIVNENDEFVGYTKRGVLSKSDIYRVSALWVTNSYGDILLAQRGFQKKQSPGKWGPAVAGTNEKGETYESNIVKEIKEEIGLSGCNLKKSKKMRMKGEYNHFTQFFTLVIDRNAEDFFIQKEEVEKLKWFNKEELLLAIKNNPEDFLESVSECIDL